MHLVGFAIEIWRISSGNYRNTNFHILGKTLQLLLRTLKSDEMFRNGCAFVKMILVSYLSLWRLEKYNAEVIFVSDASWYPKEHFLVSRLPLFSAPTFLSFILLTRTDEYVAFVDWYWQTKTEVLGNLPHFYFIHHKSDTDWPRIDLGPLLWETDN